MPDGGPHVVTQRTAMLNQVCVVVLGAGDDPQSLPATLAEIRAGDSRVVVVDALGVGSLSAAARGQIIAAHRRLSALGRRLIAVNVPADAIPPLREHGIEVGATADQVFADEPMADLGPQTRRLPFGA